MKTTFFLISTIFFMFLALNSNGQTISIQKLDSLYPYHTIFADSAKISEMQYKTFNEIKRKELFEKYKTLIKAENTNEDELDDVDMKKGIEEMDKKVIKAAKELKKK